MMSKEFLKKLGIVGITFGLAASPLAFADFHDEEPHEPAPHEEPAPDENYGSAGDDAFGGTDKEATEYDTEYEDEEEEWTFDEEEEEEEQEWETPDEDDEESAW